MYDKILFTVILVSVLYLLFMRRRKNRSIKKVLQMPQPEKYTLLDELLQPLGYEYDHWQDIFVSRTDAWQKNFGYTALYDKAAPFFSMIFDCEPIYFNYDGKTWLIEFWKGQYGINTGAEIGVYHADRIVSAKERDSYVFSAVKPNEYLKLFMNLIQGNHLLAVREEPHWWLTAFSMGNFANPENLTMIITIRFPDYEMRRAFMDALIQSGYQPDSFFPCLSNTDLTFTFEKAQRRHSFFQTIYRHYVQWKNRLFCCLYNHMTSHFIQSCDKLLYLYYYLPFLFRRILRLRRFGARAKRRWKQ